MSERPRLRPTLRVRLTLLYAALLVGSTGLLLAVSYELLSSHLHRTLLPAVADDVSGRLGSQYLLALAGTTLLALAAGWLVAGRALAPLRRITATARRVGSERFDERIALGGPDDEVRELADTFDAMLDRLQLAIEAQRRFVANASHELRSPLTVIRAEADVTLSDPSATLADLRAMGEVVIEATDRTDALLDGLMVLARSQEGLLRRDAVDLAACARRAVNHAAREAAAARVRLHVTGGSAIVMGDEALLDRLVANLVENGVRHNVEGGSADVITSATGGHALIEVSSDGAHVPREALARLADPFERLDRASRRPGSGLGLSIVRAVAEAHGGTLEIAARPEGGLHVAVRIPRGPATAGEVSGSRA